MKQKSGRNLKRGIANAFGSFGYFFCFLQWIWAAMLYFSVIQSVPTALSPTSERPAQAPSFTLSLPGPIEIIILVIVVVAVVGVIAYAAYKTPMSIAETSNKVVHKATETVVPVVIKAQHKKDTKKTRAIITTEVILGIKLLLVVVPLVLAAVSGALDEQAVTYAVAVVVACGLAVFSVFAFTLQYLLASLFRMKLLDLR